MKRFVNCIFIYMDAKQALNKSVACTNIFLYTFGR
jgi:hypothetical protein